MSDRRSNFGFSRVKKIKHSRATVHFFEEESIQKNKFKLAFIIFMSLILIVGCRREEYDPYVRSPEPPKNSIAEYLEGRFWGYADNSVKDTIYTDYELFCEVVEDSKVRLKGEHFKDIYI